MMWFFAILVVLLLGVVAVVAAGRAGTMAPAYGDRPDATVPADGPLTAADIRQVCFTTALRGYRMSEVDALLERLADEREAQEQSMDGAREDGARERQAVLDRAVDPGNDPGSDPAEIGEDGERD